MKCKDTLVSHIRSKGYNPLRYPSSSLVPLTVLRKIQSSLLSKGYMQSVNGKISDFFTSTHPVPAPQPPAYRPDIFIRESEGIRVGLGLSILLDILKGSREETPKIEVSNKNSSKLFFTFDQVRSSDVNEIALDQYLNAGDYNHNLSISEDFLSGNLYIVTSILISKSFGVRLTGKTNHIAEIAGRIENIADAKIELNISNNHEYNLEYSGDKYLTFAVKALRIFPLLNGKFRIDKGALNIDVRGAEMDTEAFIIDEDEFLFLDI